jgi:hypothetical protein
MQSINPSAQGQHEGYIIRTSKMSYFLFHRFLVFVLFVHFVTGPLNNNKSRRRELEYFIVLITYIMWRGEICKPMLPKDRWIAGV